MKRLVLLCALAEAAWAKVNMPSGPVGSAPPLPVGPPQPAPTYAKNNINNQEGVAPVDGIFTGPVTNSLNKTFLEQLHHENPELISISQNATRPNRDFRAAAADGYWLSELGPLGLSPWAPSGYQWYRNVRDFGAVGDGVTDDTAAINRAASVLSPDNLDSERCAEDCGSTTTLTALVYFPPGTYLISSPIIQYYHTQFVGNPTDRPVIKGTQNFTGIALFDSNFYLPGENGRQWYINQSNFLRQIRNFVFDMTGMARENYENDQRYVPTGIHWQIGQATSISNCHFDMAVSDAEGAATAMGIMMENGSGGVASDLTFFGGNIGFFAGAQQFTATNLQFTSCLTAIKQVWNWGFMWKNIYVLSCYIAIDCTEYSDVQNQGTGSITVLDSHFNGVPYAITVGRQNGRQPNIILDNLLVENSQSVVLVSGGETILEGSVGALYFNSWASGYQYLPNRPGVRTSGFVNPTIQKPDGLLDGDGRYFLKSKPLYEDLDAGSFVIATENGISNDGTGDQTDAINSLLSSSVGSVVYFPYGIYIVQGTVFIPVGSRIVGSGWSQIMGSGSFFEDASDPQVMIRVGEEGDSGLIEISDMMFTVRGATAGAVLMEWNVHEDNQGSAAMWDSHFRVGGAEGTDLELAQCAAPQDTINEDCMAAAMLMHVTRDASGYFDNIWLWLSDHDLDDPRNAEAYQSPEGIPLNVLTQITIYAARGLLIESQGPTWFYGSSSEHMQMYQYQLYGASNLFMGHMQTETPYYQPNPSALQPYEAGDTYFPGDPVFDDCANDNCRGAWALRIINSTNIVIYSAGFYSFFQDNELGCTEDESCQLALIETSYSEGIWIYNIFTKGNTQIISPKGGNGLFPIFFNSTTRNGYTSEVAAWLALALDGGDIGISPNGTQEDGSGDVYVDPGIYDEDEPVVNCWPPCTYILPPISLSEPTTISFPPSSTSLEVGWFESTTYRGEDGTTTTTREYVSVIVTTTLTIPAITTNRIPVSNIPIVSDVNSTEIYPVWSLIPEPFVITEERDPDDDGTPNPVVTRTITPKPWPWINQTTTDPQDTPSITIIHTTGPPSPTCTAGCGTKCRVSCSWPCSVGCDGDDCGEDDDECGETDCSGSDCEDGGDCTRGDCTEGGDCVGPQCIGGGDCIGPRCVRGGDCFGTRCEGGGGCRGPLCRRGGSCGPLFCPPGDCVGPLCDTPETGSDFPGPNNPNDPDDPDEECTTRTFSSCRTLCTARPTSTCRSTCSNVIGCDTTGTSWASTITPAPAYEAGDTEAYFDTYEFEEHVDEAQEVIDYLEENGWLGNPTTTTTTSESDPDPTDDPEPIPVPTFPAEPPLCFRDWPEEDRFIPFGGDYAFDMVESLCTITDYLLPSIPRHGIASGNFRVSVSWAEDQSGCQPRIDQPLEDYCRVTFRDLLTECDFFEDEENLRYGGTVIDNLEYGCVQWYIGEDSYINLQREDRLTVNISPEELERVHFVEPMGNNRSRTWISHKRRAAKYEIQP